MEPLELSEEIKGRIKSYENDIDLIFKILNNFGNFEPQYYTYLDLYINYFYRIINGEDDNNKFKEKDIYFDLDKNIFGEKKEINMKEFENDKKELYEFINNFNKDKDENMQIEIKNDKQNKSILVSKNLKTND